MVLHATRPSTPFTETASHTEGYIFALEASTDAVGATDYNDALSQHRADAVIQYLVSKHDGSGSQDVRDWFGQGQAFGVE